jgi:hypothetical protein
VVIAGRSGCRYWRVLCAPELEAWYRQAFPGAALRDPGRSIAESDVLSDRGGRLVVRFARPPAPPSPAAAEDRGREPAAGRLVIKEERHPFPSCLLGLFARPRAEREFHNLRTLRRLGFAAVEPVACGHTGVLRCHRRSFLISREFAGAETLKGWSARRPPWPSREELQQALLRLAPEVASLHRERSYLRTLYAKNLLFRRSPSGGLEIALCDVPRLRCSRRRELDFGLAARDLATLDKWGREVFGTRARIGFLRTYLAALGEGPPPAAWIRRIARSRDRLRHQTLLGRLSRGTKRALKKVGLKRYWPFAW